MANKYIYQVRRGWKETDSDGKVIRDDWASYEATKETNPNYLAPLAGEFVLEYDNGIPRLKIGDGIHDFSDLEYMSVDSFVIPKPTTITLQGGDAWIQVEGYKNRYTQDITNQLAGKITPNSKVDIQLTPEQLVIFHKKDVTFTTVNEGGNVRVCAVGVRLENDYEDIHITITEVKI